MASFLNRKGSSLFTCIPGPRYYLHVSYSLLDFKSFLVPSSWADIESARRSTCLTEIIHRACCPCDMENGWTHTETDGVFVRSWLQSSSNILTFTFLAWTVWSLRSLKRTTRLRDRLLPVPATTRITHPHHPPSHPLIVLDSCVHTKLVGRFRLYRCIEWIYLIWGCYYQDNRRLCRQLHCAQGRWVADVETGWKQGFHDTSTMKPRIFEESNVPALMEGSASATSLKYATFSTSWYNFS